MANSRHYRNAPITEALVDFQVQLPKEVGLEILDPYRLEISRAYPREQNRIEMQAQFSGGEMPGAKTEQRQIGYAFYSEDGKQVVQARLNGFTFSRLAPYETWEKMQAEAKKHWDIFRRLVKPVKVVGVALRYINQIVIPQAQIDLKDYFRVYPDIPPELDTNISSYYVSVQIAQTDLDCMLMLVQAGVPTPPGTVGIILDQALARQNTEFRSEDELWELLGRLRHRKNFVFENCITDKVRELIS